MRPMPKMSTRAQPQSTTASSSTIGGRSILARGRENRSYMRYRFVFAHEAAMNDPATATATVETQSCSR